MNFPQTVDKPEVAGCAITLLTGIAKVMQLYCFHLVKILELQTSADLFWRIHQGLLYPIHS